MAKKGRSSKLPNPKSSLDKPPVLEFEALFERVTGVSRRGQVIVPGLLDQLVSVKGVDGSWTKNVTCKGFPPIGSDLTVLSRSMVGEAPHPLGGTQRITFAEVVDVVPVVDFVEGMDGLPGQDNWSMLS